MFALPLQWLMLAALWLLTPMTSLAALACQCSVAGVTLWKVGQQVAESVTHHAIVAKLKR